MSEEPPVVMLWSFQKVQVFSPCADASVANWPENQFTVRFACIGWWFKPDFIINELNINSAVTSPAHDEVVPLGGRASYTIVGYAYAGALLLSLIAKGWSHPGCQQSDEPRLAHQHVPPVHWVKQHRGAHVVGPGGTLRAVLCRMLSCLCDDSRP